MLMLQAHLRLGFCEAVPFYAEHWQLGSLASRGSLLSSSLRVRVWLVPGAAAQNPPRSRFVNTTSSETIPLQPMISAGKGFRPENVRFWIPHISFYMY